MERFDFLVVGGGIAGLTYALSVAERGSVAVLFKRDYESSSTAWAQGGIAAVQAPSDSFESHIEDTLIAGADLCHRDIVEIVVREAPDRIQDLVRWGVQFDKSQNSTDFDLHREGGHSARRILHSGDATGSEIQRALIEQAKRHPNIKLVSNAFAIDLITTRKLGVDRSLPNAALGAYVLRKGGGVEAYLAKKILVATGGAGKIYLYTTNPDVATGDGVAMCFRAGCSVSNMEFFQFHPTCLYHPKIKNFLITEAMRGEGARLLRRSGEPFMMKYDARGELAPRDIVARAIDNELKLTGDEFVYLDITAKSPEFIKDHFPMIYEKCLSLGLDITTSPIPVVPAAHYSCGGVSSNEWGETEIENLFVAGETAHTGLHGANRLASNSLLEGLVFGGRAATRSLAKLDERIVSADIPRWNSGSARDSDEDVVITQTWSEIRRFMWNFVGIVRSNKRLERALRRSDLIEREIVDYYWNFKVTPDLLELRNLSLVANLVIRSAMRRRESRGLHYNVDCPESREDWRADTVIRSLEHFHYSSFR